MISEIIQNIIAGLATLSNNILSAYNTLRAKNYTLPQTLNSGNLATTISQIPYNEPPIKDKLFYDVDGTLLYSFSIAEAQQLTELPPAPEPRHNFLVFDKWGETLETVKDGLPLQVAAYFDTIDGFAHMIIDVTDNNVEAHMAAKWGTSETFRIDWGDGEISSYSGTNIDDILVTHTYTETGRKHVIIDNGVFGCCAITQKPMGFSIKELYIGHKYSTFWGFKNNALFDLEIFTEPYNFYDGDIGAGLASQLGYKVKLYAAPKQLGYSWTNGGQLLIIPTGITYEVENSVHKRALAKADVIYTRTGYISYPYGASYLAFTAANQVVYGSLSASYAEVFMYITTPPSVSPAATVKVLHVPVGTAETYRVTTNYTKIPVIIDDLIMPE